MEQDDSDDELLEVPLTWHSPKEQLTDLKQDVLAVDEESSRSTPPTSPANSHSLLSATGLSRSNSSGATRSSHANLWKPSSDAQTCTAVTQQCPPISEPIAAEGTSTSTLSVCQISDVSKTLTVSASSIRVSPDKAGVMRKIELIFENITDILLANAGKLTITLKSRAVPQDQGFDQSLNVITNDSADRVRGICFPGSSPQEAWRFTVLVRILELVHEALLTDCIITKRYQYQPFLILFLRDVYYRHPALFVKQAVVDRYIDDIAYTFGVPRLSLNVAAAAKGLIAGCFTCHRGDGIILDGLTDREGLLIPTIKATDRFRLTCVSWILVIEKEATFRSLLSSSFWETLASSGIMITAKGYPDIATRSFLRAMSEPSPQNGFCCPPVYALVDYDPDGIAIMSTYKYGSFALAHESSRLNVPQMQWLGIRSSTRTCYARGVTESSNVIGSEGEGSENNVHQTQGLLRLTPRDRRKAIKMLEWDVLAGDGPELLWRREIQVMLMLNLKAEIQIMEAQTGGLAGWLRAELHGI